jgi:hypothetical protein
LPWREARAWLGLELRDLFRSPSALLLLALSGPLAGQAFRDAVAAYAEASGGLGGTAALAQGLDPLDGIVLPTWGTYDLIAMLIFPFVAIRTLAIPRRDGSWVLAVQGPLPAVAHVVNKALALLALWIVAAVPGIVALGWWRGLGGHLPGAALAGVLVAYLLRGFLTMGVCLLAAALADGPSSAAILALAFTVGTWALELTAAGRGGWWAALARLTPDQALHASATGLLDLGTLLTLGGFGLGLLLCAARLLQPGLRPVPRLAGALVPLLLPVAIAGASGFFPASWDLSEDRRHSLPAPVAERLGMPDAALRVSIRLAPEDPRRHDLEEFLGKLGRAVRRLAIVELPVGRTGLFAAPGSAYGLSTFAWDGRTWETRSTTEGVLLEGLFELARLGPVPAGAESHPGHPLVADANGSGWVFYLGFPLAALALWRAAQARRIE